MRPFRYAVLPLLIVLLFSAALAEGQRSRIIFISQPVLTARVGVEYTYDADARSSDSTETITYALDHAPSGMTIDSTSGVVAWTPAAVGFATVEIEARGSNGNSRHQSFVIRVYGPLGKIAGQVVDAETQTPIAGVLVQLFSARRHVMASWGGMPITVLSGMTDSAGMYSIADIDTGTYYAEASRHWQIMVMRPLPMVEYLPVWWRNSPTMNGADPIQIVPEATLTVDFEMTRKVPPVFVSVSGVVTDSAGTPLKNALVVVSRVRPEPTDSSIDDEGSQVRLSTMEAPQWGEIEDASGNGRTDSGGVYSVRVLAGRAYIASAYARGYVIQYYRNKANVLEADRFTPLNDTTGFDFALTALPKATSMISGSVRDSTGQGVVSRLILFPVKKSRAYGARTMSTDSLGDFQFQNLFDGKYLLMAVPYREYLPAFYKLDSFGVWNWKNADTITLAGSASDIIIGVIKRRAEGAGIVRGRVRTSDGQPVAGAIVYASLVSDRRPVIYDVTVSDGSYELQGLPPDEYTLVADKPEFLALNTPPVAIDYATGGSISAPDMTFESVSSIEPGNGTQNVLPTSIALYQNYPNPFNPATRIQYDLPHDARVSLKVFNIIGQQVAVLLDRNQQAGSYNVEFDASQMPSGVYFYRLQADNSVLTKKMIIMR